MRWQAKAVQPALHFLWRHQGQHLSSGGPTAEAADPPLSNKEQNVETTEQVGNQPQPAATTTNASPDAATTAELEKHSSFLGYRPGIEVSADEPVTSADTEVTEGDGETEAAPAEAQTTEEDDPNWLPTDQQKVFPDDVIAKYAKRYGYTEEQIRDNPGLRQLLHDKINSDIFLAKVRGITGY